MADPIEESGHDKLDSTPESTITIEEESKDTMEAEEVPYLATNDLESQKQIPDATSLVENANLNTNNDIELTKKDLKQQEEEFASLFVAGVLSKVVKELSPADDSVAQGDNVVTEDRSEGRDSDNHELNNSLLNQGAGDGDKLAGTVNEKNSEPNPIIVPTDRDLPEENIENNNNDLEKSSIHNQEDEKKGVRSEYLSENNEQELAKEESVLRGQVTNTQEGQEVFVRSHTQGRQELHRDPDHVNYYRQFQDDSASQMDRTSTISAGVFEIQIPQHMLKSYAAGHVIRVPAYHHPDSDQFTHNQVSQSYPPPAELFPSHQSRSQTFSPRSTPTPKLVQFPKLRTSSTGYRGEFLSAEQRSPSRFSQRQKLPPSVARMSSVMMTTRERTEKQRMMSTYYEERTPSKLLTLDQCINSRPPMPYDLDTPGPCRYTPRNQPLYETNAPKYTFGYKFFERDGGGRTAWSKTWFNSQDSHTTKVNFEHRWPSPANHSSAKSLVGRRLPTKMTYPSYSVGVKSKFSISKRGAENEPSPNEYYPGKADGLMYNKAPAFSMTFRHRGTSLWSTSEHTPGPSNYTPRVTYTSSKPHRPAFTIQGIRRPKSHALGPHATF